MFLPGAYITCSATIVLSYHRKTLFQQTFLFSLSRNAKMKGFCRANEKLWFLFIFLLLIDGGHSALQKPLPKTSHDIGEELQAGTCESYFTGQRLLTHLMEFKAYKCTCCRKILQSRFFSHFKLLLNEIEGFLVRQRHI